MEDVRPQRKQDDRSNGELFAIEIVRHVACQPLFRIAVEFYGSAAVPIPNIARKAGTIASMTGPAFPERLGQVSSFPVRIYVQSIQSDYIQFSYIIFNLS
jgi:hypothetical protein